MDVILDAFLFTVFHSGMIYQSALRWYPAKGGAGYGGMEELSILSLRPTYAPFAAILGCDVKTTLRALRDML